MPLGSSLKIPNSDSGSAPTALAMNSSKHSDRLAVSDEYSHFRGDVCLIAYHKLSCKVILHASVLKYMEHVDFWT